MSHGEIPPRILGCAPREELTQRAIRLLVANLRWPCGHCARRLKRLYVRAGRERARYWDTYGSPERYAGRFGPLAR